MADIISNKLGLTLPEVGASADTWGDKLNADLAILDTAIQYERLVKSVAGGVTVNLTAEEASYTVLRFTGLLTANIAVTIPVNPERQYIIENATTGAFTLTFRTLSGIGVEVSQGKTESVYNNGTDIVATPISIKNLATVTADLLNDFVAIADVSDNNDAKKALFPVATDAEIRTATASKIVTPPELLLAQGFTAYYESPPQTISSAGALTLAHGLGRQPIMYQCFLKNIIAQHGYAVGDETEAYFGGIDSRQGVAVVPGSTNIFIRYGSLTNQSFSVIDKGTGITSTITNTRWQFIIRAWA